MLTTFGAATVLEAAGKAGRWLPGPRTIAPGSVLAGPVTPIAVPQGDNLQLHEAIATCRGGEVIVVAAAGDVSVALMGEIVATAAIARGVAGIVTDGAVRDSVRITELGLPVFAGGLSPVGPRKERRGLTGTPIVIGGVPIEPTDCLVGDDDGVVVFPGDRLEAVLEAAASRHAKEFRILEAVRAGASSLEALGLEAPPQERRTGPGRA